MHPPWYVSLFMADVVAECMKRIVVQFKGKAALGANAFQNLHDRTLVPKMTYLLPGPLLAPLYNHSAELQEVCNISIPFILSAIPRSVDIPAEKINWRKGWIEHVSHSTPGWEINNQSNPSSRALSFPLQGDTVRLTGAIVMVSYLRSYEGMGTAIVHACGAVLSTAAEMNGLVAGHVSIPFSVFHVINSTDIVRCQLLKEKKRFLSVVYTPGTDEKPLRDQHGHLFKVFSVQVCTPVLVPT